MYSNNGRLPFYYRNGSGVTYGKTLTYNVIDINLSTRGHTAMYYQRLRCFRPEIASYRWLYQCPHSSPCPGNRSLHLPAWSWPHVEGKHRNSVRLNMEELHLDGLCGQSSLSIPAATAPESMAPPPNGRYWIWHIQRYLPLGFQCFSRVAASMLTSLRALSHDAVPLHYGSPVIDFVQQFTEIEQSGCYMSCRTYFNQIRPSYKCLPDGRIPSLPGYSRTSCARERKKLDHITVMSAEMCPQLRICVATPTGHVLAWHLRIMTHPKQSIQKFRIQTLQLPTKPCWWCHVQSSTVRQSANVTDHGVRWVPVFAVSRSDHFRRNTGIAHEEAGEAPVPPSAAPRRWSGISLCLCHTAGNGATTTFSYQFHTDFGFHCVFKSNISWAKSSIE